MKALDIFNTVVKDSDLIRTVTDDILDYRNNNLLYLFGGKFNKLKTFLSSYHYSFGHLRNLNHYKRNYFTGFASRIIFNSKKIKALPVTLVCFETFEDLLSVKLTQDERSYLFLSENIIYFLIYFWALTLQYGKLADLYTLLESREIVFDELKQEYLIECLFEYLVNEIPKLIGRAQD